MTSLVVNVTSGNGACLAMCLKSDASYAYYRTSYHARAHAGIVA